MLGLAHDRIVNLCMIYLDRGYILKDEYDDLVKYLIKPYSAFGGNGLAEKLFEEVKELPIKRSTPMEITRDFRRKSKAAAFRRENDSK
nr:MAG TPA: holin protein [Caudoviricetes sp.]